MSAKIESVERLAAYCHHVENSPSEERIQHFKSLVSELRTFQKVYPVIPSGESKKLLDLQMGRCYLQLGRYERAYEIFSTITTTDVSLKRRVKVAMATALGRLGRLHLFFHRFDQAKEKFLQALMISKENSFDYLYVETCLDLVNHARRVKDEKAAQAYESLSVIYAFNKQGKGLDRAPVANLNFMTKILEYEKFLLRDFQNHSKEAARKFKAQDYRGALKGYQEVLEYAQQIHDLSVQGEMWDWIGLCQMKMEKYSAVIKCYQKSAAISKKTGNLNRRILAKYHLGEAYYFQGEVKDALYYYGKALKMLREKNTIPDNIELTRSIRDRILNAALSPEAASL